MHFPARDAELVQIIDASLADAARRAGASSPAALAVRSAATAPSPSMRLTLRASAPACPHFATASPALAADDRAPRPRLARRASARIFPAIPQTGALGTSAADQARFEDFANDAPCPALDPATGRCDVYAWRPMTCRVFGPPVRAAGEDGAEGLGHCELCFIGATQQSKSPPAKCPSRTISKQTARRNRIASRNRCRFCADFIKIAWTKRHARRSESWTRTTF